MLKLTPKTNLKSLFLTGAATTATLASPMMMETASALTFASPNPGCSLEENGLDVEFSVECKGIYQGNVSNAISQEDVNALFDSRYDWNLVAKVDIEGNGDNFGGLVVNETGTEGTWEYTRLSNLPLMFILKGGPTFSAYLMYDPEKPSQGIGLDDPTVGYWNTNGLLTGSGAPRPGLSNFAVYQAVPEPLTLLGAASAIGFGAVFKKRLEKKGRDQDQA